MKTLGIILAGGNATRLYPTTLSVTKQLLPVYDKPMIYYPLSTLMLAGVRDYVIIHSLKHQESIHHAISDEFIASLGINVKFCVQHQPIGIADAFNLVRMYIGQEFIDGFDKTTLILGDNIFYGAGLTQQLVDSVALPTDSAQIYLQQVKDPERYGIATMVDGKLVSIEEKPINPTSNLAITGLYIYPQDVYIKVLDLIRSKRNELEITDLNQLYLEENRLLAHRLQRGTVWFDAGTPDALLETSNFIAAIQKHQDIQIGCPHEIALSREWVTRDQWQSNGTLDYYKNTTYGDYLQRL